MIKAAFFDIDGTLKPFGEDELRDSTIEMLKELQNKGIRAVLATGRPPVQLPLLGKKLNAFPWDGYVMINGQYCMDENKIPFYKLMIPKETLKVLVPWLKSSVTYACSFFEADFSYEMRFNEGSYQYMKSLGRENEMPDIIDPVRSYTHDTYQLCPYCSPEEDTEFVAHAPGMKSARWASNFADMIPEKGGKPVGVGKILERFGLKREECIAFGDGGNDISMLAYAGIGVAMGNANDEVKAQADYVTADSDKNGIRRAFEHYGILDEKI